MDRFPKITRGGLMKYMGESVAVYSDSQPHMCPINGFRGTLQILDDGARYAVNGNGDGSISLESGDRIVLKDRTGRHRPYRIEL